MDNIYNRPLFRQMGGTAMPSPQEQMAMQQPMPMSPPMEQPMVSPEQIGEQLAQAEADVGAQGVGIGQELAKRMLEGLDSAETPKDIMDSIRGDDKSVEERRTELAEFVGDEDANQTPETVLAMVQPTIMLTERGAMDSGVGELMEGVADVDMETMEGEPTDVGGGVASLMGVGQQPVQNFRYGGIVQKFDLGGDATSRQLSMAGRNVSPQNQQFYGLNPQGFYEKNLPFFESLFDTQQQRQTAKANLLFDIAKAGAALATGVNPLTGQRQKMNVVETLSSGLGAVADPLKQYGQAVQQAEQQPKMMAAQEAIKQADEQRKFEKDKEIIETQGIVDTNKNLTLLDAENAFKKEFAQDSRDHEKNMLTLKTSAEENLRKIKKKLAIKRDNNLILEKLKTEKILRKINQEYAIALEDKRNDDLLERFGLQRKHEIEMIDNKQEFQKTLQGNEFKFKSAQNDLDRQILKEKNEQTQGYQDRVLQLEQDKFNLEKLQYQNFQELTGSLTLAEGEGEGTFNNPNADLTDAKYRDFFSNIPLDKAFGPDAAIFDKVINNIFGVVGLTPAEDTNRAIQGFTELNTQVKTTLRNAEKDLGASGRPLKAEFQELMSGLPDPGAYLESNVKAKNAIRNTVSKIDSLISQLQKQVQVGSITDLKGSTKEFSKVYPTLKQLQILKGVYIKSWHNLNSSGKFAINEPIPEKDDTYDYNTSSTTSSTTTGGGDVVDTVDKMSDE